MINNSTEGILFPSNFQAPKNNEFEEKLPQLIVVPRKSWNYVEKDLVKAFEPVANCKPANIYVFSFLRNGKIGFDDPFCIYTDSDCEIEDSVLVKNDDICSEEFAAEILIPIFREYYPNAKVNQFLATEKNDINREFFEKLVKNNPTALFVISKNETEDSLWPDSLLD